MVCPPPQAEGEESDGFQEPCDLDRDGEEGEPVGIRSTGNLD